MDYIESNLLQNEKLIYATRPHWIIFASGAWLLFFAFYVEFFVNIALLNNPLFNTISARELLALGLLVMGAYTLLKSFVYYKNAEYGVTDKRVLIKVGWIQRESLELMLDKVEGVLVDQDVMGRIFSYGMITIIGTGGTKDSYPYIPHPLRFRKAVQQAIENFETSYKLRG